MKSRPRGWDGSGPTYRQETVVYQGAEYKLGRNWDNVVSHGQYIGPDPAVMSFILSLGIKSERLTSMWGCKGVPPRAVKDGP